MKRTVALVVAIACLLTVGGRAEEPTGVALLETYTSQIMEIDVLRASHRTWVLDPNATSIEKTIALESYAELVAKRMLMTLVYDGTLTVSEYLKARSSLSAFRSPETTKYIDGAMRYELEHRAK